MALNLLTDGIEDEELEIIESFDLTSGQVEVMNNILGGLVKRIKSSGIKGSCILRDENGTIKFYLGNYSFSFEVTKSGLKPDWNITVGDFKDIPTVLNNGITIYINENYLKLLEEEVITAIYRLSKELPFTVNSLYFNVTRRTFNKGVYQKSCNEKCAYDIEVVGSGCRPEHL